MLTSCQKHEALLPQFFSGQLEGLGTVPLADVIHSQLPTGPRIRERMTHDFPRRAQILPLLQNSPKNIDLLGSVHISRPCFSTEVTCAAMPVGELKFERSR